MVTEFRYTKIQRILDDLYDHEMLRDVTMEQVIRYTLRFMSLHGYPKMYQNKVAAVDIESYRGVLPCDLVSIVQVRDCATGVCLRAMTGSFTAGMIGKAVGTDGEFSFKTQGSIIYTSFEEGQIEISYRAIPVDEDNHLMIIDNEVFIAALEAYIKKIVFVNKFDQQKIPLNVLQHAEQDYAQLAGQLSAEFQTPSPSEMEAYTRYYNSMLPRSREFDNGFSTLGNREYLRKK